MLYAREAQEAGDSSDACSSSREALERVYTVRQSIASARPYSASLLAYGESYVYAEGVLCYVNGSYVRVLNVHSASEKEQVIDVLAIDERLASLPESEPFPFPFSDDTRIASLSYSEGVLVCVCESDAMDEYWLLVIDLDQQDSMDRASKRTKRRASFRHRLSCTTKLFVRHNQSYLYYGTHSGRRSDGHHEWLVNGLDLETGSLVAPKPFQLADFVGSDIGSTACFKIHEDALFAVSNQTSFEVEEVDWTSYYHCIKIPLGDPTPDLEARPKWQRQHKEGPINDSWTDLSLQKDAQTNSLLIVECRKEWLGGGSANIRTYYTQPLVFDTDEDTMEMLRFPTNDPLTRTLDEHSKPHFSEPRKRLRKHYHHEYEQSLLDPRNSSTPPRDFILAKTKFRAYSPAAMSFIDLVSDPTPLPHSVRLRDRLRLRIASRKQKSPLLPADEPHNPGHTTLPLPLLRPPEMDESGSPIPDSELAFHPTEIHLWPPEDAPAEIYDVLCPSGRVGAAGIDATADERSIVYMADPPPSRGGGMTPGRGGERAIVMISFDETWGRKYRELALSSSSSAAAAAAAARPARPMKLELPNTFAARKRTKRGSSSPGVGRSGSASASASASGAGAGAGAMESQSKRRKCDGGQDGVVGMGGQRTEMWEEDAMYLALNRGYRFR